jgi:hypothetical protein
MKEEEDKRKNFAYLSFPFDLLLRQVAPGRPVARRSNTLRKCATLASKTPGSFEEER